jgi:hypothetical protein
MTLKRNQAVGMKTGWKWKWQYCEDAVPRKNNLFEFRIRTAPTEHVNRDLEGKHTSGKG